MNSTQALALLVMVAAMAFIAGQRLEREQGALLREIDELRSQLAAHALAGPPAATTAAPEVAS